MAKILFGVLLRRRFFFVLRALYRTVAQLPLDSAVADALLQVENGMTAWLLLDVRPCARSVP